MSRQLMAVVLCALLASSPVSGEDIMEPSLRGADRTISIPFAFYNESFGVAAGYVYAVNGYPQPWAGMLGTVMAGTEGSAMGLLMGQNIRLFGIERLFFDPILSVGYFSDVEAYVDGNPDYPDERAGSNESDRRDYITGSGWDSFFRLRFRYLLPIGDGREQVLPAYQFRDGLLAAGASGAHAFNPVASGRTFLELRPFYRSQNIENDDLDEQQNTNGLELSLFWDNRDYPGNPSAGNGLIVKAARDWGLGDSSGSWTSVSTEYDQYVSLGDSARLRQRVLAFDFSTAYSPSWRERPDGTIVQRPPAFTGATLGGIWRMRGYPGQRFNDKASIYYATELRLIPRWNPFDAWPWFQQRVGVEWVQLAAFGEVGRVAPHWNFGELHEDMRWDAGIGVRAWAKGLVLRADFAVSDESFQVQMMVSQPFQF